MATFLTSASSVMQPHVDVPADYPYSSQPVLAGGLSLQIARAKILQQRYMAAVSDQTLLTNSLAITTIPLSAAALAVGITNPGVTFTRNFLTGAGAGTAAALGLGAFLVDRRRDAIYQIANNERSIADIATAISAIQTDKAKIIAGFAGRTQGGRAVPLAGPEERVRRSVELVTAWLRAYQNAKAVADAKLQTPQCTSATGAQKVQPTVIVTNGQGVTIGPQGQVNVQPPPPPIRRRSAAPSPVAPTPLPADISTAEMSRLRTLFGLTPTNAAIPNSPKFRKTVEDFQRCKGNPVTGRLTQSQKELALSGNDACLPERAGAPTPDTTPPAATTPSPTSPGGQHSRESMRT